MSHNLKNLSAEVCHGGVKVKCQADTLDRSDPITILEAPWIKFPRVDVMEELNLAAIEVVRRAIAYEVIFKEVDQLQKRIETMHDMIYRYGQQFDAVIKMWDEERTKYGREPDFKDIPTEAWPRELKAEYIREG